MRIRMAAAHTLLVVKTLAEMQVYWWWFVVSRLYANSSRFSFSGRRGDYIGDSSVIWSSSSNFYWDCDIDHLNELERPRESASFLMLPVYSFIAIITLLIVVGLFKIVTGAQPLNATALPRAVVPGISIALVLRAFSSGSSSLTGVEAISNAVPFFKKPRAKNAAGTLALMATILGSSSWGLRLLTIGMGLCPKKK